jgi:hypothetical protein
MARPPRPRVFITVSGLSVHPHGPHKHLLPVYHNVKIFGSTTLALMSVTFSCKGADTVVSIPGIMGYAASVTTFTCHCSTKAASVREQVSVAVSNYKNGGPYFVISCLRL